LDDELLDRTVFRNLTEVCIAGFDYLEGAATAGAGTPRSGFVLQGVRVPQARNFGVLLPPRCRPGPFELCRAVSSPWENDRRGL